MKKLFLLFLILSICICIPTYAATNLSAAMSDGQLVVSWDGCSCSNATLTVYRNKWPILVEYVDCSGSCTLPSYYTDAAGSYSVKLMCDDGCIKVDVKTDTPSEPNPTEAPTVEPTAIPTEVPTVEPTIVPTEIPTVEPTIIPTEIPTVEPTAVPTEIPTVEPTAVPTEIPTVEPTIIPTEIPTVQPTVIPTEIPTVQPTVVPTAIPTVQPTAIPTVKPTPIPTAIPTVRPTAVPTPIPTVRPTAVPTQNPGTSLDSMSAEVVRQVNEERTSRGLGTLSVDAELTRAACVRAQEIVELFSHTRPDGSSWSTVSSSVSGENIAKGQKTADKVMAAWMTSDGHRENILREGFTRIGVCSYKVGNVVYWAQLFGR